MAAVGTAITLAEVRRGPRPAWAQSDERLTPVIRVLIRQPGGSLDGPAVQVTCPNSFAVRDGGDGSTVAALDAGETVSITRDNGLWLQLGSGRRGPFSASIRITPDRSGAPVVYAGPDLARPLSYRGLFEVVASLASGRVALVNHVGLDDYVRGVVAKEMPPSFGLEAVRAQAVASRGFALARAERGPHREYQADVCDAVDCQVYSGVAAEHPAGDAAVEATRGLILTRGGVAIEPLYSSTCGGHTEEVSRLFGAASAVAGSPREAVPDGELPSGLDLGTDAGAAAFLRGRWDSHCSASGRYRWEMSWDRRKLEETLTSGLRRLAGSRLVSPAFPAEQTIGTLTGLAVTERGISGRALSLRIESSNGTWTVQRDWTIRNVLRTPDGEVLASSAFALDVETAGGKPASITAFGGGWGHGAGMCQWGARGLAARDKSYEAILGYYYPGSDLSPVTR